MEGRSRSGGKWGYFCPGDFRVPPFMHVSPLSPTWAPKGKIYWREEVLVTLAKKTVPLLVWIADNPLKDTDPPNGSPLPSRLWYPSPREKGWAGTRAETVLDLMMEPQVCNSPTFVTNVSHSTFLSLRKGVMEAALQSSGWLWASDVLRSQWRTSERTGFRTRQT